jgi:hypothetical protein
MLNSLCIADLGKWLLTDHSFKVSILTPNARGQCKMPSRSQALEVSNLIKLSNMTTLHTNPTASMLEE